MNRLLEFFHMGGYGYYVWIAYSSVIVFLAVQFFIPWQRWRRFVRQQFSNPPREK